MQKSYYKLPIYFMIVIFFIHDLWLDYLEQEFNGHFYLELVLFIAIFSLFIQQINQLKKNRQKLLAATNTIKNLQGEMAEYINQEFKKWQLTNAEKEVAWLIVKGFSFKEIAHIRKVSEKTISQQSATIYKKSGHCNRHELMSAFLEEFINFPLH
ncbi:MAG: LuxR C-terminal-related transcriptional regulator [Gammaproteobacteria bacterium]|nr:LuxR C-terminal-related transcriptional regulator [Gammaproteobacteria bacterium]